MLNQYGLFPPTGGKLKNRLQLIGVTVQQSRYILENCHYLGRVRVGRQINYAVMIDGLCDGVITYAYPFTTSTISGVLPGEVVEFARLYLLSNIEHSASCAVGKSLRRIKNDWSYKYKDAKELKLVVSWSDTTRHKGTIYKASNFIYDGSKKVNPRRHLGGVWKNRKDNSDYHNKKDRWLYWL